jgi:mannose/fructose/N-acetylgalactosamine-specific phosphotransferase system component IIC
MWNDLLMVSLIGGLAAVDTTAAWQVMICRPIVSGPLLGFALGDLQTGLLFGALMELVWAGAVPVGASVFPDSGVGTVIASAIAIVLQDYELSLHFAILGAFFYMIPVAYIGEKSIVLMRRINTVLMRRALDYSEEGRVRKVVLQNWLGLGNSFGRGFLYSGLMFVLGSLLISMGSGLCLEIDGGSFQNGVVPVLALGGGVLLSVFGKTRNLGFLVLGLVIGFGVSLF